MNARLCVNEFSGFYPDDRRTDEQLSDDFRDCVHSKISDPEWLREWFGNADLSNDLLKLLADSDYIAFGCALSKAQVAKAEEEARSEA